MILKTGHQPDLQTILNQREKRASLISNMLKRPASNSDLNTPSDSNEQYVDDLLMPPFDFVITILLNIPGPTKNNQLIMSFFQHISAKLIAELEFNIQGAQLNLQISRLRYDVDLNTGPEMILGIKIKNDRARVDFSANNSLKMPTLPKNTNLDSPEKIKTLIRHQLKLMLISFEDEPWGRLLDLDIFSSEGQLGRQDLSMPERQCFLCSQNAKICGRSRRHSWESLLMFVEKIIADYLATNP